MSEIARFESISGHLSLRMEDILRELQKVMKDFENNVTT
jgi:hypothetical protein